MVSELRIELCSPPDREKLVAAIMVGGEQWVEVNQEADELSLEIYPRKNAEPWRLNFDEAIDALLAAKARLRNHSTRAY